jgi:hypothetical protein
VKIIIEIPEIKQLMHIIFIRPKIPDKTPEDNSPVISPRKEQKHII